jgi:hypothetical protein
MSMISHAGFDGALNPHLNDQSSDISKAVANALEATIQPFLANESSLSLNDFYYQHYYRNAARILVEEELETPTVACAWCKKDILLSNVRQYCSRQYPYRLCKLALLALPMLCLPFCVVL